MSQRSARVGSFPGRVGKSSRDIGRVFGADLAYDTARAPGASASGGSCGPVAPGVCGRPRRFRHARGHCRSRPQRSRQMVLARRSGRLRRHEFRDRNELRHLRCHLGLASSAQPDWLAVRRRRRCVCDRSAGSTAWRRVTRSGCTHGCAAARDHDLRLVPAVGNRTRSPADLAAVSRRTSANAPLAVGGDRCDRYGTACSAWTWAHSPIQSSLAIPSAT